MSGYSQHGAAYGQTGGGYGSAYGGAYRQMFHSKAATRRKPVKPPLINYPRRGYGPIHRWLPSWRFVLGTMMFPVGIGAGLFYGAWYTTHIPDNLDSVNSQITTIYYNDAVVLPDGSVQGTPIGTLAKERRIIVDLADLPAYVGNAVVASEDQTFWTNQGVDLRGIARALYNNVRGGQRQGASTLTQQYVERYYTDTVSDYVGKAKEAIMALKVSQEQPKEQILAGYLNTIYWGRGAYGIEAASQMYFGHPSSELTISESAMLAGIIPSPSRWDPSKDEKTARNRFDRTIAMMLQGEFITEAEAQAASFPEYLPPPKLTGGNDGQNGYLINEVVRELTRSGPFAANPEQITTLGLNIITTIDHDLQADAGRIGDCLHPATIAPQVAWVEPEEPAFDGEAQAKFCKDLLGNPDKLPSPNLQMGLVSVDPTNGEYKALYGGQNYAEVQFNFATDGRAQGGSTFKPFTLIAALEEGHQLNEVFDGNSGIEIEGWQSAKALRNYGNISYGNIDLIKATANSVNTVFAQLNIEVGPWHTADIAHTLGIPDVTDPAAAGYIADNPANVLGTASVRPVDLAHAYATIAGDGYEVTPHIVREVHNLRGDTLYEGPTERWLRVPTEFIDATTYALQQVVQSGSGKGALSVKGPNGEFRPIAGKTGSANDNLAAWFAGYTPQLVTVVGLHQDTDDGLGEETITPFGRWKEMTGSTFPVTAWATFMKAALAGQEVIPFHEYTPPLPELPEGCFFDEAEVLICQHEGEDGYWVGDEFVPNPTPSPTPTVPELNYVTVPSGLVGGSYDGAASALSAVGLTPQRVNQQTASAPAGTVISVSSAGQLVPPGSIIVVTVAEALPVVTPPPPPVDPTPEPTPTVTPTGEPVAPPEPPPANILGPKR